MRTVLKPAGIVALSVYFTQQLIPAITFAKFETFIIICGLIFLANLILGPLTKILFFIPSNLIFLNLLQVFGNFLVLYFATASFEEFDIGQFYFGGFTNFGVSLASINLNPIQTTIVAAILLTIIFGFFRWLAD